MLKTITNNHAVHQIGLHLVWCTKFRNAVLKDSIDVIVKQSLAETCGHYGWLCHAIEVMPDHVHMFIQIKHTDNPCDVAKTLKSISAVAAFYTFPKLKGNKFWGTGLWSDGTYYGSVGNVSQDTISTYIAGQKKK